MNLYGKHSVNQNDNDLVLQVLRSDFLRQGFYDATLSMLIFASYQAKNLNNRR